MASAECGIRSEWTRSKKNVHLAPPSHPDTMLRSCLCNLLRALFSVHLSPPVAAFTPASGAHTPNASLNTLEGSRGRPPTTESGYSGCIRDGATRTFDPSTASTLRPAACENRESRRLCTRSNEPTGSRRSARDTADAEARTSPGASWRHTCSTAARTLRVPAEARASSEMRVCVSRQRRRSI